jgi:hypothetical protein
MPEENEFSNNDEINAITFKPMKFETLSKKRAKKTRPLNNV